VSRRGAGIKRARGAGRARPTSRYTHDVPSPDFQAQMARARAALERGRGTEALAALGQALRSPSLRRDDELVVRCAQAEAWLLQDDIDQASASLGRPPDSLRESIDPARLSDLWRLHGRIASARGDQSRAIALLSRALRHAEQSHDSRAIGLAHYELALAYRKVGDVAIVREHLNQAASALHAAGDRRHLALTHSLSGIAFAEAGRHDDSMAALRQGEQLAAQAGADDVRALICGNEANVAMMRHRHEQALALAERSVALHEASGSPHGLAIALATLGQICVRLGNLGGAERALNRALAVRSPVQFHETTGAVYDTLTEIHLVRGSYEQAEVFLGKARDAYGAYGRQTSRWYEWSIRLLGARLALRRGELDDALRQADDMLAERGVPPADGIQAELVAAEALLAAGRGDDAEARVAAAGGRLDPRAMPGIWGAFLRVRAGILARSQRVTEAYHDLAQSASTFVMLGERYQAALTHLALGLLLGGAGARSAAQRHLDEAVRAFTELGASPDLEAARAALATLSGTSAGPYLPSPADADDVIVKRLVDAAVMPDLLAIEVATTMVEACGGDAAAVFVETGGEDVRVVAAAGCEPAAAALLARSATTGSAYGGGTLAIEPLGRDRDGPRRVVLVSPRPIGHATARRARMIASVARQGFELSAAREGLSGAAAPAADWRLDALVPGFVCASAAMNGVVDQVRRLQETHLTVLITGESGTGKELVARAIHVGSPRGTARFLAFNCTTTTRDLADSQLFGHRRGAFTGAIDDQPGLARSADGGTLFLDEIGDVPIEVQPKLLRFLEEGEILPVGDSRPQKVDVRVIAATNADLEQRVAEGRFREDLFYRLAVIRIHVPPLRERAEEIPHLVAYFLRESADRLGKADVRLSTEALDLLCRFWWPGNVRQLRNEIQRAVALGPAGGTIGVDHLSSEMAALQGPAGLDLAPVRSRSARTLADAVAEVEREAIRETLRRTVGNISEGARQLGLTRRGLYLKMQRLGLKQAGIVDTE